VQSIDSIEVEAVLSLQNIQNKDVDVFFLIFNWLQREKPRKLLGAFFLSLFLF